MRTIICKKCGATIDAALGECPNCGAMYYILPEENEPPQQPTGGVPPTERDLFDPMLDLDISRADNEDIFNTSVWKTAQDPDATRTFTPRQQQPQQQRPQAQQPQQVQPRRQTPQQQRPQQQRQQLRYQPQGEEPPEKKRMSVKTKRLVVAAIALVALLVLIIALMSDAFNFDKNDDKIKVPNMASGGITVEAATLVLENLGLVVTTQERYDEAPAGTVIAQSIKADKLVKEGEKITLTVSLGPKTSESDTPEKEVTVPGLVGKSYTQASYELAALGLDIRAGVEEYSDKEAGTIISQNPTQGTVVKEGDIILVIVSKGPEPSPSPTGYKITVTAGAGGSITPKGVVTVVEGEDQVFTITPNEGYEIREVKVDGRDVGAVTSYTFTKVTSDHTIYVVFKVKSETPTTTPPVVSQEPPASTSPDPSAPVE